MSKPLFITGVLALSLTACSTVLNHLPGVYALEIQQGNIVEEEMIDQLKPHMSKRQVLYIMGSPMLKDMFHQSRWNYVYSDKVSGQDSVKKRVTLVFNGDELAGMQGDLKPGGSPVIRAAKDVTVNVPKRDLDRTLWEKISGLFFFMKIDGKPDKDPDNLKPKLSDSPY